MKQSSTNKTVIQAVAVIMAVVGPSTFNILPLLSDGAVHGLGLSDRQIGVMSFALSMGSGLSSLVAGLWVRSVQWRGAGALSLGGMLIANVIASALPPYPVFVTALAVVGVFGGSALCLAFTILSDRKESARGFGLAAAAQVAYQVAGMLLGPKILEIAGLRGILVSITALNGVALLLVPLLPHHGRMNNLDRTRTAFLTPRTLLGLLGCAAFFANAGAYWTYVSLMGEAHGLSSRTVADCIATGVAAGVLGGGAAWLFGERIGLLRPIWIAAVLTIGGVLLASESTAAATFMLSGLLYYFAWSYSVSYQFALINAVDKSGSGVASANGFAYLGAAAGAAMAGLLVAPPDYSAIMWLVVVAVSLSTVLFVVSFVMPAVATTSSTKP